MKFCWKQTLHTTQHKYSMMLILNTIYKELLMEDICHMDFSNKCISNFENEFPIKTEVGRLNFKILARWRAVTTIKETSGSVQVSIASAITNAGSCLGSTSRPSRPLKNYKRLINDIKNECLLKYEQKWSYSKDTVDPGQESEDISVNSICICKQVKLSIQTLQQLRWRSK